MMSLEEAIEAVIALSKKSFPTRTTTMVKLENIDPTNFARGVTNPKMIRQLAEKIVANSNSELDVKAVTDDTLFRAVHPLLNPQEYPIRVCVNNSDTADRYPYLMVNGCTRTALAQKV